MITISLEAVVALVIYILVAGMVFGLLTWLTYYVEKEWPPSAPFAKIARVVLVILAVLVLIGILLAFIGHPVFVLRG
jgi:amino acid transporter